MNISQVNVVRLTEDNTDYISDEYNIDVIGDIRATIDLSMVDYLPLSWLDHKHYYDSLVLEIEADGDYDKSLETVLEFV